MLGESVLSPNRSVPNQVLGHIGSPLGSNKGSAVKGSAVKGSAVKGSAVKGSAVKGKGSARKAVVATPPFNNDYNNHNENNIFMDDNNENENNSNTAVMDENPMVKIKESATRTAPTPTKSASKAPRAGDLVVEPVMMETKEAMAVDVDEDGGEEEPTSPKRAAEEAPTAEDASPESDAKKARKCSDDDATDKAATTTTKPHVHAMLDDLAKAKASIAASKETLRLLKEHQVKLAENGAGMTERIQAFDNELCKLKDTHAENGKELEKVLAIRDSAKQVFEKAEGVLRKIAEDKKLKKEEARETTTTTSSATAAEMANAETSDEAKEATDEEPHDGEKVTVTDETDGTNAATEATGEDTVEEKPAELPEEPEREEKGLMDEAETGPMDFKPVDEETLEITWSRSSNEKVPEAEEAPQESMTEETQGVAVTMTGISSSDEKAPEAEEASQESMTEETQGVAATMTGISSVPSVPFDERSAVAGFSEESEIPGTKAEIVDKRASIDDTLAHELDGASSDDDSLISI